MVAPDAQFDQQQFMQAQNLGHSSSPRMKSEPGVSEAVDQPVLSYPPHAPLNQMPNINQDMRYAAHPPNPQLPMLQNPYAPAGYSTTQIPNSVPQGRPDPPPKTFHCGTCGKGFARRSDLARHGKRVPIRTITRKVSILTCFRTDSLGRSSSRLRMAGLWKTVHSTLCSDSTFSGTHG